MPLNTSIGRPKRRPAPVRARIGHPYGIGVSETSAPYADVWCGRCGQKLPGLDLVGPRDPLVQAGFAAAGDVVLRRPRGWRWDGATWRLTRDAERELERMEKIASNQADWERDLMGEVAANQAERRVQIARMVLRETRVGQVPSTDYPGFDYDAFLKHAGRGLILPTSIECPGRGCNKRENVIDVGCSAPR
jgi:hypothetical protein